MHVTQVHPVTTENQFHCTRLYIKCVTVQNRTIFSLSKFPRPLTLQHITHRNRTEDYHCAGPLGPCNAGAVTTRHDDAENVERCRHGQYQRVYPIQHAWTQTWTLRPSTCSAVAPIVFLTQTSAHGHCLIHFDRSGVLGDSTNQLKRSNRSFRVQTNFRSDCKRVISMPIKPRVCWSSWYCRLLVTLSFDHSYQLKKITSWEEKYLIRPCKYELTCPGLVTMVTCSNHHYK